MIKSVFTVLLVFLMTIADAQVKIGHDAANINSAAILELGNDTTAAPSTWKSFMPPQVNFTNAVFTSNTVWGIAGTPTAGAMVYNKGDMYLNGFFGPGIYCWQRDSWVFLNITVVDKIRMALSTSIAAYDATPANSWVSVTAAEYNNLLTTVTGAARYAATEARMNSSALALGGNITVGGNGAITKVPSSSYIIAWSVRTGSGGNASGSKLKISSQQQTGYADYGNALPATDIAPNTRIYFVMKAPFIFTPAAPCYTAVYNFDGLLGVSTGGTEYYTLGDSPTISTSQSYSSHSQVISTTTKQW